MARFTKKGPRVVPPEPISQPQTDSSAPQTPPAAANGRPPSSNVRNKGKDSFWNKVRDIPKEEWGKRAWIYVYCLEPVCNLKTAGENKYLVKSAEPITDEDSIMHDYGSGKYRLNLVYRKPAADRGDEVDATEIEIYNPKYPPKIPRTAWMNDPRNERWAALLPKEEPQAPANSLGQVTEAFKTFTEIQKEVRSQSPPPAPTDDIGKFTGMVTALKAIMPQSAPATDNTMLGTVVTLLTAQINASQQEAQQLRNQVFELIKAQRAETNGIESIIEKADSWLPKLKGLLNLGGDKLTEVVHGRPRKWWEDILIQTVPPVVQSFAPVIPMMVGNLMQPRPNGMNGSNGNGGINGNPPQQPQLPQGQQQPQPAATPMQQLMVKVGNFLGANMRPLQKYFDDYLAGKLSDPDDPESAIDGVDFAMWLVDYHGEQILKDARALGSAQIMQMFRGSVYWPAIQPHEAKLSEFLDQVLSYSPEPEEGGEGPIDLTQGGQEA